jgi:uncharacterized membrane protein HdeD (DUF308 family)
MNSTKALGVIVIVMGILAMLAPVVTGLSIIFVIGIFVILAGISRLVLAFQASTTNMMFLMSAIGVLTVLCGIALLSNPLFASGLLTILLSIYFIVDGALEFSSGLTFRELSGSGWLIFAGLISILLGIMIMAQFPISGMWAIGILFGIKLFFVGIVMISFPTTD